MKKEFFRFLLLGFFSLLLLFFDHRGWLKTVRGWLEQPMLGVEEKIYGFFASGRKQEEQILRLEGKLRQLAVNGNQLASCLEENEKMRKLLGAPLPSSWKFLPAKVVGLLDQMRLDKGEKDGVKQGMMVVSENILVGRVDSVEAHSCLVTLPITPNTKIPVVVRADKGIKARGTLVSQPGPKLILDKVLQQEDIQPGDLVVTSVDWLPDLVIGQIEEVLAKPVAIYKKAKISPLVDYHGLRIVFIVIKS